MIIVRDNGTIILEEGDPNYVDLLQVGPTHPQNELLDEDPDQPLSTFILNEFGIPFDAGFAFKGSSLPGYDIKNQNASTMMKLALLTELIGGRFIEIEIDEFGIARYYTVGTAPASDIDVRYCVPTSTINQPINLVIVRGYDPPPVQELRTSFDGLKNKELMAYEDCAQDSCEESFVARYATISYDDPLLDQQYLDDVKNSYELKAFESLVGYLVDLDLPDNVDNIPGFRITFGDTTKEYIRVDATIMNNSVGAVGASDALGDQQGDAGKRGFSSFGDAGIVSQPGQQGNRSGGNVPIVINIINESNINNLPTCGAVLDSIAGGLITFPKERFIRENKFGRLESDFIGITDVVFAGNKIKSFTASPGGFGIGSSIFWVVDPNKDLVELSHGRNWTWTVNTTTEDIEVYLFSILEDARAAVTCQVYSNPELFSSSTAPTQDLVYAYSNNLIDRFPAANEEFICNIGDDLGYWNASGKMCVVVERRRPSIDIFDPLGNASTIADEIAITYTPVIMVDTPPPVTYAANKILSSIDQTRTIPSTGVIDQTDGIVDQDPTTTQDLEESETSILQDNTDGFTLDISLPFCEEDDCLLIAQQLLALQEEDVRTNSIILGPDSNPRLGQLMPDGSVINEISYSYSDSSQYLITLATGPKYQTVGGFNDSKYQLQATDVTKEGVVIQDAGNGAEYVVRVDGFGEITALTMILDDISVGDRVNVKIHNNPVEHI